MKILFFTLMTTVFTMGCANGNSQRTPSLTTNDENSTHQTNQNLLTSILQEVASGAPNTSLNKFAECSPPK